MNLGNPFLIKLLMILFSLEGFVSMNDKIHSHIGNHIILSRPRSSGKPQLLIWSKNSTFIADFTDNNITMSKRQPEPNKYQLFLNGSLKINRLKKTDAGNYTVKAYDERGRNLFHVLITLQVDGFVSMNDKIHSHIGNHIILSRPRSSGKPQLLIWSKNSTFIADFTDNNITMSKRQPEPNKYQLFLNGSLKINRLKKTDAGNYTVKAYDERGRNLFHVLITLQVDELLPKLNELCSQRILTCEMKSSEEPKPRFKLFQDTKEIEMFEQPVYDNATWKMTLQLKVLSGKFRCEVDVSSETNNTEKQITCSGEDLLDSGPMLLMPLIIMGSVVTLIIFLALIIYGIRRKKAKRCEREAEEYALQIQINNHMQQRKLPDIPVSSDSNSPSQKSRSPPSELQQQIAPSKSCPHPKPPRRIKERP